MKQIANWVTSQVVYEVQVDSFEHADLSGLDLSFADLKEVKLRGANLSQASLVCAVFDNADLREVNLCGTDLRIDRNSLIEIKKLLGAVNDREIELWADLTRIRLLAGLCSAKWNGSRYDGTTMWPDTITGLEKWLRKKGFRSANDKRRWFRL